MKKMRQIILTLLLIGLGSTLLAQTVVGTWGGKVNMGLTSLRIKIQIEQGDSCYTATMYSPDQSNKGIPVKSVSYADGVLSLDIPRIKAVYKGRFENDTLIDGTLTQNGAEMALKLTPGEIIRLRPQEPKAPYPYRTEDVTFRNEEGKTTLSGTLTIPSEGAKFPCLVLVSGSGAQNRDEEILGHKPFLVLADYLTRHGIAVLRYDDRGFGRSTGNFAEATTEDFAKDALCAIDYLTTRGEIDPQKIGIGGHSEGGSVTVMAAAMAPEKVGYIVSMAGVVQRGDSILLYQNGALLKAMGTPDSNADCYVDLLREIFRTQQANSMTYIREHSETIMDSLLTDKYSSLPKGMVSNAKAVLLTSSPWLTYFRENNPSLLLPNVRCPVLAIGGGRDLQVDNPTELSIIERIVRQNGNQRVKTTIYPKLNHLLQECQSGLPNEYGEIEQTIAPEVLEDIKQWILETTK